MKETPTVRARRLANYLLSLLTEDVRDRLTKQAHALGDTWLGQQLVVHDEDDILPPAEAAALVHVTPDILRSWIRSGALHRQPGGGYRVGDIYAAQAEISRRRQTRARRTAKEA